MKRTTAKIHATVADRTECGFARGDTASKCLPAAPRVGCSLLTLLAEPDLTHCEMEGLNSAQYSLGQNSLFSLRISFGAPAK